MLKELRQHLSSRGVGLRSLTSEQVEQQEREHQEPGNGAYAFRSCHRGDSNSRGGLFTPPCIEFPLLDPQLRRKQLPLLDPQPRREYRLIAPYLLDEALGILAPDERLDCVTEREVAREDVVDGGGRPATSARSLGRADMQ